MISGEGVQLGATRQKLLQDRRIHLVVLRHHPVVRGMPGLLQDLLGRMCVAVKPVDMIGELLVADVVSSEWEVIRWRNLKFSLLQASVHHKLGNFLNERLDYEAYRERFAEALAEVLRELCPKNFAEGRTKELAHQYARSQPDAVKKVGVVLKAAGLDPDEILEQTKRERAEDLVQEYARREPEAVKLVKELLASSGETMRDLVLEALSTKLDEIEPIDRLITLAETRRNISLREIDRRRAVLGEALRRKIEEVEGDFEIIETTPGSGEPGVSAGSS